MNYLKLRVSVKYIYISIIHFEMFISIFISKYNLSIMVRYRTIYHIFIVLLYLFFFTYIYIINEIYKYYTWKPLFIFLKILEYNFKSINGVQ